MTAWWSQVVVAVATRSIAQAMQALVVGSPVVR